MLPRTPLQIFTPASLHSRYHFLFLFLGKPPEWNWFWIYEILEKFSKKTIEKNTRRFIAFTVFFVGLRMDDTHWHVDWFHWCEINTCRLRFGILASSRITAAMRVHEVNLSESLLMWIAWVCYCWKRMRIDSLGFWSGGAKYIIVSRCASWDSTS